MNDDRCRGLFVTGTDTGVGKTFVTGGLAAALRGKGVTVGVMKPVETGCLQDDGSMLPADAQMLREMAGDTLPLSMICPYQFKEPLAPSVAAEREGVKIDLDHLVNVFETISRRHEFTLVESAGGLMVPLYQRVLFLDLIKRFNVPVLIVGRATLGTINHILLTLRVLEAGQIPIAGIVINNLSPEKTLASETNPAVIAALVDVPFWGVLPYQADLVHQKSVQKVIPEFIQRHLNLEFLFNLVNLA